MFYFYVKDEGTACIKRFQGKVYQYMKVNVFDMIDICPDPIKGLILSFGGKYDYINNFFRNQSKCNAQYKCIQYWLLMEFPDLKDLKRCIEVTLDFKELTEEELNEFHLEEVDSEFCYIKNTIDIVNAKQGTIRKYNLNIHFYVTLDDEFSVNQDEALRKLNDLGIDF